MALVARATQRVEYDEHNYEWTIQLIKQAPFRRGDDVVVANTTIYTPREGLFADTMALLRLGVANLRDSHTVAAANEVLNDKPKRGVR